MPFTKGHKIRPRNPGRKKKESTEIKELMEAEKAYTPAMIKIVRAKALAGDQKYIEIWFDRVYGRARQEIDARVTAVASMSPEDYELATRLATVEEQKLLSEASL